MNGKLVETALAVAAHDAVVALLTPASAPAVLDDPVVLRALRAVTDDGNAMVEAGRRAEQGVGDTAEVELHGTGVDGDGERAVSRHVSSHVLFVALRKALPRRDGGSDLGLVELALSAHSSVRVICFRLKATGGDNGRHGLVHKATVAALVNLRQGKL